MESFFGGFKVEHRLLILDAGSFARLAAVVQNRIAQKIGRAVSPPSHVGHP
ncbi:hypothetical protein [Candidatus Palauibacter sp.]|uniref:hypothetical protein n=1 Tax=Candidatus Palauibacter sp. TaxID=3101350 RepID=UPI003B5C0E66